MVAGRIQIHIALIRLRYVTKIVSLYKMVLPSKASESMNVFDLGIISRSPSSLLHLAIAQIDFLSINAISYKF